MRIRYSPAARDDLRQLRDYIAAEFGTAVAAKSVAKVLTDISTLKRHRGLARPLCDKIGRETKYLYFLCGRYSIAILSEDGGFFSVVRVLDGRTDYARTVFDDVPADDGISYKEEQT